MNMNLMIWTKSTDFFNPLKTRIFKASENETVSFYTSKGHRLCLPTFRYKINYHWKETVYILLPSFRYKINWNGKKTVCFYPVFEIKSIQMERGPSAFPSFRNMVKRRRSRFHQFSIYGERETVSFSPVLLTILFNICSMH